MNDDALDTRTQILAAARRLIAERGVDSVSVRDILQKSGVRNGGAVGYYFGSKEDMIREIIGQGARRCDARRIEMLDRAEASPAGVTLKDVVSILIRSSIGMSSTPLREDSYSRFIAAVQATHPNLYNEVVTGRWDLGDVRLMNHIRRLLAHLPTETVSQRIIFAQEFLNAMLLRRDRFLVGGNVGDCHWDRPYIIENLINTVVGMLSSPAPADPEVLGRSQPAL